MGHSTGALRSPGQPSPTPSPPPTDDSCVRPQSPSTTDALSITSNDSQILTTGDINFMKGMKVIDEVYSEVLAAFYEAHFPGGGQQQALVDWFLDTGQKWKREFSKDQREAVESRTPFRLMDLTLQYKILRRWCGFRPPDDPCWLNDPTSEEYWLHRMKNQRNIFAHEMKNLKRTLVEESEKNKVFDDLSHTAITALDKLREYKEARNLPVQDVEELKDKMVSGLDALKRQDIVVDLMVTEERLKKNGILETKENTQLTEVQPFPEILGVETFQLHQIYEPIDLYMEKKSLSPSETQKVPLTLDKILSTTDPGGHRPNVICLDGESGSGKSTLLAFLLSDYLDARREVEDLDTFDLVLHFQCKSSNCGTTLKDLIKSSLPKTSSNISDDLLVRAARKLNLLVLADGFDEVSDQATALLKDLYRESHHGNLRILLTTRTGSVHDAVRLLSGIRYLRMTIFTMPMAKAELLAKKFSRVLRSRLTAQPDEDQVVKAVCDAAKLLVRTPRCILLLTYLACVKPHQLTTLLTVTDLLDALDEIYEHLLHQRLASKGVPSAIIKEELASFNECLNALALECLLNHEIDMCQSRLRRVADTCSHPSDMLDTFLACTRRRTATGDQILYSFPHMSQLEYRAALGIRDQLVHLHQKPQCWPSHPRVLHRILRAERHPFPSLRRSLGMRVPEATNRHWNLLLSLIGVLKLSALLPSYAHELAHLVLALRSSDEDAVFEAIAHSGLDATFCAEVTSRWRRHEWLITKHVNVLTTVEHFPNGINLVLRTCCNDVPALAEVIQVLRGETLQVSLSLLDCMEDHCARRSCCSWPLTALTAPGASCSVWRLQGPVDERTTLPRSLRILHLSVGSPEGMAALKEQLNQLPYLTSLGVRVSAKAGDMQATGPPVDRSVDLLWLYDVTDEDREWVAGLLASFHAQRTYRFLWFGENQLSPAGYRELVDRLWELGVRTEGVAIHAPTPKEAWLEEHPKLSKLTHRRLGSHLRMLIFRPRHR